MIVAELTARMTTGSGIFVDAPEIDLTRLGPAALGDLWPLAAGTRTWDDQGTIHDLAAETTAPSWGTATPAA